MTPQKTKKQLERENKKLREQLAFQGSEAMLFTMSMNQLYMCGNFEDTDLKRLATAIVEEAIRRRKKRFFKESIVI